MPNLINLPYEMNVKYYQGIDSFREEYLMWITHLFGPVDPRMADQISKITFADVELYLTTTVQQRIADNRRKQKEEEEKQKALLAKLKAMQ